MTHFAIQDPDGSKRLKRQATKASRFRNVPALVAVAAFTLVVPLVAQASIISFFTNILEQKAEAAGTPASRLNSQNIPLLKAALNTSPSPLKGGGDITIVGGMALLAEAGPSGTIADIPEAPKSDTISIYVVRDGDTLSGIAKMFGVSVNTIVWANDIKRGIIHEGDTLIILPISGIQHTVVKGETLQSIAKKYKGDVEEILQFNNLESNAKLAVGDVIVIPDGEIAAPAPSSSGVATPVRGGSGPSLAGYFIAPLANYRKTQGLHGYNGVDLAASYGAPVMAAAAGQVIISRSSGWNGGYGNYVVIAHANGTQTLYSHLSSNTVGGGQFVAQGQVIGYEGQTGKATGPHLHFEVRGAKNPF